MYFLPILTQLRSRAAGPGCVRAPVQRCKTVRTNPKPKTKRMMRRYCRDPTTNADFKMVRELLQEVGGRSRGDGGGENDL